MSEPYDVIVVGAGAAGCVLANRLSAHPGRTVLLLEAGPDYGSDPDDWPTDLLDPSSIWPAFHDWGYALAGRQPDAPFPLPRSRLVGGTTAVNGCVWLRGSAADFDDWAARGNTSWGFDGLLPFFRRAENDPLRGPLAGTNGPVPVYRVGEAEMAPAERAFLAAAAELGIPYAADLNLTAKQSPCAGPAPKNIADGIRMNGAFTYLAPARERPNLVIRAETTVDRLVVENGKAVAVSTTAGEVIAGREILLCAGAYGSPAILLRSGIGPSAHLRDLGIPVVADLPGVGEHLLDHPLVSPDRPTPRLVRAAHAPRRRSFIPVIAKAASRHAGDDIDLHIYIGQDFSPEHGQWFLWITASLQCARSRGRLRLTSRDPLAPLEIDHAYVSDPSDLEALCDGVSLAERLIASEPMRRVLEPIEDAPPWGDDARLPAWVREHAGTTYHPSSTCRMGPGDDPDAVVDHRCRVHGIAGVRVADASIFPTGPRANLHFTAFAAAEKAAQSLTDDSSP